jgi:hypothetical protein
MKPVLAQRHPILFSFVLVAMFVVALALASIAASARHLSILATTPSATAS